MPGLPMVKRLNLVPFFLSSVPYFFSDRLDSTRPDRLLDTRYSFPCLTLAPYLLPLMLFPQNSYPYPVFVHAKTLSVMIVRNQIQHHLIYFLEFFLGWI